MQMIDHSFPRVEKISQLYSFELELENFFGIFQMALPENWYVSISNGDPVSTEIALSDAHDDLRVTHFLLCLRLVDEALEDDEFADTLHEPFIQLLQFALGELAWAVELANQLDSNSFTKHLRDYSDRPVKSLIYLFEFEYLFKKSERKKGFLRFWLQQMEFLFTLRLNNVESKVYWLHKIGKERLAERRSYLYRNYAASWRNLFSQASDYIDELLSELADSEESNVVIDFLDTLPARYQTPDSEESKNLRKAVATIQSFLKGRTPDHRPRKSHSFAKISSEKWLRPSINAQISVSPINGVGEFEFGVSEPRMAPNAATNLSVLDQTDEDEDDVETPIYIQQKTPKPFYTRAQVNQFRMRVNHASDALTRSNQITALDYESLNEYDLQKFIGIFDDGSVANAIKVILVLLIRIGFPKDAVYKMPIGLWRKGKQGQEGIWLRGSQLIVIYQPFQPSQQRKYKSDVINHSRLICVTFEAGGATVKALCGLFKGRSGHTSLESLIASEVKLEGVDVETVLKAVNDKNLSRLSQHTLSNTLYRLLLTSVPGSDKAQAISLFARAPDMGYVPIHYQSHSLKRLRTLLMLAHLELNKRLKSSITFTEFDLQIIDLCSPEGVVPKVNDSSVDATGVTNSEVVVTGANRAIHIDDAVELRKTIQLAFPKSRAFDSRSSEQKALSNQMREEPSTIAVFNEFVSYTALWLLLVYGLRPTRQFFLLELFVNMEEGFLFLSQKDDSRYTHSTVLPLTEAFVENYKNFLHVAQMTRVHLETLGYRLGCEMYLQPRSIIKVARRDQLLSMSVFCRPKSNQHPKLTYFPKLVYLKVEGGKVKAETLKHAEMLRKYKFDAFPTNLGRQNIRTRCRNELPSNEYFLPDELVRYALSHGAMGTHCLSTQSSFQVGHALKRLRRFYSMREKKFGFSPRNTFVAGKLF